MAFGPGVGGTLARIQHVKDREERERGRKRRKFLRKLDAHIALVSIPTRGPAFGGWKLFLLSAIGISFLSSAKAVTEKLGIETQTSEELFEEVQEFLRRQRPGRKGQPPKGLGVPIPIGPDFRGKRGKPIPAPSPDRLSPPVIRDGFVDYFRDFVDPPETPDPPRKRRKQEFLGWLERRLKRGRFLREAKLKGGR